MAAWNPIEVQKHLKGMNYPASKEQVVELARENGADDGLIQALENVRSNEFDGPDDVMEALGQTS